MNKEKGLQLFELLNDKDFLQYKIVDFINNGKSAAVFKAIDKLSNPVAIKIFDNDLIERFGHEIQETRIKQEIELANHGIPNLIEILSGGKHVIDKSEYYYIIMQYLEGKNLKDFISSEIYDDTFLRKLIGVLFNVTEDLLQKNIAHRDIKPENIMVLKSGEIVLLDLGVLKFVGSKSFSDVDEKQFVGTLRYAPPEFLIRAEEDSLKGWRAINLYQVGAVLHDLIMKRELFDNKEPYTNLVLAIKEDSPYVDNNAFTYDSNQLARDLLTKDRDLRLKLADKERIALYVSGKAIDQTDLSKAFNDFHLSSSENKLISQQIDTIKRSNEEKEKIKKNISNNLDSFIEKAILTLHQNDIVARYSKISIDGFPIMQENTLVSNRAVLRKSISFKNPKLHNGVESTFIYKLEGDIVNGFLRPVHLLFRLENDENSYCCISTVALIFGTFTDGNRNIKDALLNIAAERGSINSNYFSYQINTNSIFEGVIAFDDTSLNIVTSKIFELLQKIINVQMPEAKLELEYRRKSALGENVSWPQYHLFKKTIIISE